MITLEQYFNGPVTNKFQCKQGMIFVSKSGRTKVMFSQVSAGNYKLIGISSDRPGNRHTDECIHSPGNSINDVQFKQIVHLFGRFEKEWYQVGPEALSPTYDVNSDPNKIDCDEFLKTTPSFDKDEYDLKAGSLVQLEGDTYLLIVVADANCCRIQASNIIDGCRWSDRVPYNPGCTVGKSSAESLFQRPLKDVMLYKKGFLRDLLKRAT